MSTSSSDNSQDRQTAIFGFTNQDKVLYPATGFTKGQVIDYYQKLRRSFCRISRDIR